MYYIPKFTQLIKDYINLYRLRRYYKYKYNAAENKEQWVIFMCDGHRLHGGLADRLSGLVSTYAYCKEYGKVFKGNYNVPYKLELFLMPNQYDWRIDPQKVVYNKRDSKPLYLPFKSTLRENQRFAQKSLNKDEKQLHVYSNMRYFHPINFKYLFAELFKPTPLLQNAIDKELANLPKNYVSITFRFQQLLGDLKERNFPTLKSEGERSKLINECLEFVKEVHRRHPDLDKFLVTSDSSTFLKEVRELPYVYTIPGNIVHMDFNSKDVDLKVHMKSFVDLFLIANAETIYTVVHPPLFRTRFPMFAASIYGHRYIELTDQNISKT